MERFGSLTALLLALKETKYARQTFETKFLFSSTNLITILFYDILKSLNAPKELRAN